MKRNLCGIFLMIFLLATAGCAWADPNLTIADPETRSGGWAEEYRQILQDRSSGIQDYQTYIAGITYSSDTHPVGLTDLTGDGIPELLFVEQVHDTEYGFEIGRLWIYTADSRGVYCALTLTPETDDLLYSSMFLMENGLLTIHLTDMEMGWTLQFEMDQGRRYEVKTTLASQEDFSGEGPDQYFLNGMKVSADAYQKKLQEIQSAEGTMIGSFLDETGFRGFAYTVEEAIDLLGSGDLTAITETDAGNGQAVNGSAPDSQLPELTFFRGEFTPGDTFAVYSAPSAKSWRGANGKASITSGSEIFVAGTANGWLLIQYELNSGVIRVGYVELKKIKGDYSPGSELSFAATSMKLVDNAVMTDDPINQGTKIGSLKKGAAVTCLAQYQGMIYVEAKVSGKTARGFIPAASLGLE